ncbi:MAG: hypothetical protein ACJAY8_001075, partial [Sphingobacteriales bacterium]
CGVFSGGAKFNAPTKSPTQEIIQWENITTNTAVYPPVYQVGTMVPMHCIL